MDNKKDTADGTKVCACLTCHDHGSMHGGTCCCCHGGGRFSILRIVLVVLLLIFVFWFGVKVGEVKSLFYGAGPNRYMMMHYGYGGYGNAGGGYPVPVSGTGGATSTANSF